MNFNRNSNKKQAKQRQEFSRFLNLLWEKRDNEPRFFSLILSCGIRKSLPEIGHLSEQNFFAPLFLQPLHFGPSFVESWASDTEEWVCCCKISDLLLKMQNGFLARLAHSRYWSSDYVWCYFSPVLNKPQSQLIITVNSASPM